MSHVSRESNRTIRLTEREMLFSTTRRTFVFAFVSTYTRAYRCVYTPAARAQRGYKSFRSFAHSSSLVSLPLSSAVYEAPQQVQNESIDIGGGIGDVGVDRLVLSPEGRSGVQQRGHKASTKYLSDTERRDDSEGTGGHRVGCLRIHTRRREDQSLRDPR